MDIVERLFEYKLAGRHIVVELFTEVPNPELYPDYAEVVQEPISMKEISKRARLQAYENEDDFLSDFELMVENAKTYNGEESPVVDDAIALLDFVLGELGRPLSEVTRQKQQLKILHELLNYKYKGRKLSEVFIVEPSREDYPEYYEVVKEPTSFTTVESRIQEVACETWDQFSDLVEPIFNNAMVYNQEGSQIYSDASALKKQLHNKVARMRPAPPPRLKIRPPTAEIGSSDEEEVGDEDDEDDEDEMDIDDEEVDDEPVVEHRFDDDDDDDFEADPDDFDDEDIADEDDEEEDKDSSAAPPNGPSGMPMMMMMPPEQQTVFRDEIVHRELGKTARDGLIQLVTVASVAHPQFMRSQGHMGEKPQILPPIATDLVHLRIPASRSHVMTAFSTTLPAYHHTLGLNVYLHEQLRQIPFALSVLLNGRKLPPMNRMSGVIHEDFQLRLSPGLNQVTICVIRAGMTGTVRPFGAPPIVGTESDEERLVLWLNLMR